MRLRGVGVLLAVATLLGGCSRLTFIKPNADKREYVRTAPEIELGESSDDQARQGARHHTLLAQRELARGDLDAAESEARQALKLQGDSADAYTLLGVIASNRGRAAEAGGHYRRAAELAPSDGGVLNNYGAWLCSNGRAAESLTWFDRAIAAPGYRSPASALANAGSCAEQGGQPGRAERDLRAALGVDPENSVALGAMAQHQFRKGGYLDARAFSQRRLAAAPADAHSLLLASQIEEKLGDTAAAARYVRRLREEFPDVVPGNPGENTQR